MDKVMRFSKETLLKLEALRKKWWKPGSMDEDVITELIEDRYEVSDQHINYLRRRKSFEEWAANKESSLCIWDGKAYTAGYNQGWLDFQTRHHHFEYQFFTILPPEEEK